MKRSHTRGLTALPIAACVFVSCATADPSGDVQPWVGTITTEGNVTTVVNKSGSVWGGTARLVEEASIGVDSGPEEYMLGQVRAVYATDDEIYVLDNSVSAVRVYDLAGNYRRSLGSAGQGPGELGTSLTDVAVHADGRVFVGDQTNRRISIYSSEGTAISQIPFSSQVACCLTRFVFDGSGGMWLQVRATDSDSGSSRSGVRVHTVHGPVGAARWVPELQYDRRVVPGNGREYEIVPFAATLVWTLSYNESLLVGTSDRYEFRIVDPDGNVTSVERFWDPTPITAREFDYWRRMTIALLSPRNVRWNGENIPEHKPAYLAMLPSRSGELWLTRWGATSAECATAPEEMAVEMGRDPFGLPKCLLGEITADVFDSAGRYLGAVEAFPYNLSKPFIDGDTVVALTQDAVGTNVIKRYRLVLPGEQ